MDIKEIITGFLVLNIVVCTCMAWTTIRRNKRIDRFQKEVTHKLATVKAGAATAPASLRTDGTQATYFWLPGEEERGICVWYDDGAIIVEPHCPHALMRYDVIAEKCLTIRYAADENKPAPEVFSDNDCRLRLGESEASDEGKS